MKKKFYPLLWLISGVILTFAGVLAMLNPMEMSAISYTMGIATLFYAILNFLISRKNEKNQRWVLSDGIQTLLVALLLLCNAWLFAGVVPVIVALWVIYSGVNRCFLAFDLKGENQNGWYWILLISLLAVLLGFLSLLSGIHNSFSPQLLTGILLAAQGITTIFLWICTSPEQKS